MGRIHSYSNVGIIFSRQASGWSTLRFGPRCSTSFTGLFVFPTVAALQAGNADFFTRSFGSPTTNFAESRVNAFLQDHWQARRTLALDYGLRYEINRLPSPLPTTGIDFSPRLGFAWTAQPSLVVRGGFGLFYDRYLLSSLDRLLEFDGAHASMQIVEGPTAASLYSSGSVPSSPSARRSAEHLESRPAPHQPLQRGGFAEYRTGAPAPDHADS